MKRAARESRGQTRAGRAGRCAAADRRSSVCARAAVEPHARGGAAVERGQLERERRADRRARRCSRWSTTRRAHPAPRPVAVVLARPEAGHRRRCRSPARGAATANTSASAKRAARRKPSGARLRPENQWPSRPSAHEQVRVPVGRELGRTDSVRRSRRPRRRAARCGQPVSHGDGCGLLSRAARSRGRACEPACCITQRCAVVGSTSRESAGGETAYSAAARTTSRARDPRARACPLRRSRIDADAGEQRRHQLHDDAEPRVRAEHRQRRVEQRGRPGERERPIRPLRRQRADERGTATMTASNGTRASARHLTRVRRGHQWNTATRASATTPQPRLTCCSSSPRGRRRPSRSRRAVAPSSGCATGGTR